MSEVLINKNDPELRLRRKFQVDDFSEILKCINKNYQFADQNQDYKSMGHFLQF